MKIIFVFMLFFLVFLLLVLRILRIKSVEWENALMQSYIFSMEAFYESIRERIEAARKYRHDLAKHIRTLEYLLKSGGEGADEIEKYRRVLEEKYQEQRETKYSEDEIINTVLMIKKQQCEEKGIPLDLQAESADCGNVREVDMVSLLHNLLDNALEANERIGEKEGRGIIFMIRRTPEGLEIHMQNRIPPGERVTFRTKKKKAEEHGIGTKIIDDLIGRYAGTMETTVDEENHLFLQKIFLRDGEKK